MFIIFTRTQNIIDGQLLDLFDFMRIGSKQRQCLCRKCYNWCYVRISFRVQIKRWREVTFDLIEGPDCFCCSFFCNLRCISNCLQPPDLLHMVVYMELLMMCKNCGYCALEVKNIILFDIWCRPVFM